MLFPGITKVLRRFEFFDALMSLRFDWTVAMAKKVINDRRNSKVQHVYIYIYLFASASFENQTVVRNFLQTHAFEYMNSTQSYTLIQNLGVIT